MFKLLKVRWHYIILLMVIGICPEIYCYSQTQILIQAEEADTIKTGSINNNDQGYTGTGFVNLDNVEGTYVVWMINLPTPDSYTVTVRYANGSTDRTMNIYVNHVLKKASFNFPSTGSWTTWQTLSFQLDLAEGLNHLKFSGSNPNSGPSLDYISINSSDTPPVTQVDWSVEMANMIINTRSTNMNWDYTVGLMLEGILRVYKRTHDQRYLTFIRDWAQYHISADGTIDNHLNSLDNMMPGFTILHLYRETGIERFKLAADKIRDRLKNSYPRAPDGCYWHMTDLQGELWLDGLYMGMPFLATYGKMIGDNDYAYSETIKQFKLHINYLTDNNTGLLLHAFDYDGSASWALPPNKRSPYAWGRAIGWVMMGLSEILDIIPEGYPQRNEIVEQYKTVLRSLAEYQDPVTGLWYQVVDHQTDSGNWLETSCSMMFVYSMARAIEKGFLDDSYKNYVTLGYTGILTKISQDANKMVYLKDICGGTAVSADIQYYFNRPRNTNDNHGLGTFLIMNELVKYNNLPWIGTSPVPILSIEPSVITLASISGANGTFNVTSNTDWSVTENVSWLDLSSASGNGNKTITVTTASANTSVSTRSANVTFSATGVTSVVVTVTQSGAGPTLAVTPSTINVAASSGVTGTINITSNTGWTASEITDWLNLSTSSGTGNGTITVTTASANFSVNTRSANVTLSATGVNSVTITVTQSGANPALAVTPSAINLAALSWATGTINIISNTGWTASENADWLNLSTSSGTGNGTITVTTTSANFSVNTRSANVTLSATGVNSVTITVTQSGANPALAVTPSAINVAASSGATGTVNISSNTGWTASENADWLNLSTSSGTGNGTIIVTTSSANPSVNTRSANVTFSVTGVNPVVVSITQAATISTSIYEIANSGIKIFPNPVSGILTIDYKNYDFEYFNIISSGGFIISNEKALAQIQQFDFSKYGKGLYILEFVRSDGETVRVKVINN